MAIQFPDDFKCPISLEVMSDPVILSSGHTFNRSSIQRWLDSGHRTCPISKLPLPDHPPLIPNHALRSLISNFTLLSPISSPLSHSKPQTLISTLVSNSAPTSSKLDSLTHLVKLTKSDSSLRRQLTESGAVAAVLNCVNSENFDLKLKALNLLLNLSLDDHSKVGLVAEGAISYVVSVLRAEVPDCRAIACTVLTSLAVVEVNKAIIGNYPDVIEGLVEIIRSGKGREVRESATALYAICAFPGNRKRVVEIGAVPELVRRSGMGLERAVEVLSLLVKCKEGREEMVRGCEGLIKVLVRVLREGSEKGVQSAFFVLSSLCCCSENVCREALQIGVLESCVGLVEDENDKIRKNASSLIRTLSGFRAMQ